MPLLDGRPKWTTIRGFGNIKYFNISYAILATVPILDELHKKAAPLVAWFGNLAPFSATLKWLYAASLIYAIAIAIYQFRCPKEIRRFGEPDEYIAAQHELFCRAQPHHRLAIVLARLDPNVDGEIMQTIQGLLNKVKETAGRERVEAQNELNQLISNLHPDAVQRYLEQDYEDKNQSQPISRWIAFFLYMAGTLILLSLLVAKSCSVFLDIDE